MDLIAKAAKQDGWNVPPEDLVLTADEVHVWRAWLDCNGSLSALADLLSPSEMQKGMRFCFPADRERFIVAHGVLRLLLGHYVHRDPVTLQFITNEFGKPSLLVEQGDNPIKFNLSHSHNVVLFIFARGREVGIDVEHIRAQFAERAVAEQFFAPEEIGELQALDPALRVRGFFNCWTRKESYIKARGLGLSLPLDNFQVSLRPGSSAVLLRHDGDSGETLRWCLRDLSLTEGYVGSLAVEGHDWQLKNWEWSSERLQSLFHRV